MTSLLQQDTIAAIATAPGRGGVGIIRVSGTLAATVAEKPLQGVMTKQEHRRRSLTPVSCTKGCERACKTVL